MAFRRPTAEPSGDWVRRLAERWKLVGSVGAVTTSAGTTYSSSGWSTQGGAVVDESMAFEVGSVSKTFTALLLADMVVRREVALDMPVAEAYERAETGASTPTAVTLGRLAFHGAGLPITPTTAPPRRPPGRSRLAFAPLWSDPRALVSQLLEDASRQLAHCTQSDVRNGADRAAPGHIDRYRYSNFGYALLGDALAAVTATPFPDLLAERVLAPLGLAQTTVGFASGVRAVGHGPHRRPVSDFGAGPFAPAGGICSTAADMSRYLVAHLDPSATPLRDALRLVQQERLRRRGGAVGLGWHRRDELWWHNGGTAGFHAFAAFRPAASSAIVLLTNTVDGTFGLGLDRVVRRRLERSHAASDPTNRGSAHSV